MISSSRHRGPSASRAAFLVSLTTVAAAACSPVAIDVDPGSTFQTFEAWSATVEIGDSDMPQSMVAQHREEVVDWVVDSLGITRLRLAIKSGYEHPEDRAPAFLADNNLRAAWRQRWFTIENDNDDPYVADPDGFQFFFIDHLMETVILPIRSRLEERGERLYLNLNYVDFGSSPFEHRDNPEEFAEFIFVVVQHLESKYGVVADAVEILEPDNDAEWSARQVAEGLVAVGERLDAAGYDLDLIGPSNINMRRALEYFDEMITVPGLDRYLAEFSYHRYGRIEPDVLREIARVASEHGLRTSMLEFMFATTADLYQDLTLANVSVWQKFGIDTYVQADTAGRISYRDDVAQVSQYMRNIRPGAIRLGATSSKDDYHPVAFSNADGSHVLVVRAGRRRSFTIEGLPEGRYDGIAVLDNGYETVSVPLTEAAGVVSGDMPRAGLLVVRSAPGS